MHLKTVVLILEGKMLIFAHTGLTLGVTRLIEGLISKRYSLGYERIIKTETLNITKAKKNSPPDPQIQRFSFQGRIDYRLVLLGSMLPDIIDKPIGQLFFQDFFSNGRIFCHTLLFVLLITLIGLYLYLRHKRSGMLVISSCSMGHLILDGMWREPVIFLWPAYGWTFPKTDLTNWLPNILHALLTNPGIFIPEYIGGVILITFALRLLSRGNVLSFLRTGIIE